MTGHERARAGGADERSLEGEQIELDNNAAEAEETPTAPVSTPKSGYGKYWVLAAGALAVAGLIGYFIYDTKSRIRQTNDITEVYRMNAKNSDDITKLIEIGTQNGKGITDLTDAVRKSNKDVNNLTATVDALVSENKELKSKYGVLETKIKEVAERPYTPPQVVEPQKNVDTPEIKPKPNKTPFEVYLKNMDSLLTEFKGKAGYEVIELYKSKIDTAVKYAEANPSSKDAIETRIKGYVGLVSEEAEKFRTENRMREQVMQKYKNPEVKK